MADRFPSIEDLDEGQTVGDDDGGFGPMEGGNDDGDFLSRERAALGDDANQFSTPRDNIPTVSVEDGADDDLLGGGGGQSNGTRDDINKFQSSFPAVDTRNERMAPGGTITGSASPFLPGAPTHSPTRPYSPANIPMEDEPEVIKTWRATRDEAIAKREEVSAARKTETVKGAQQAIDEFYENYNNKKEKGVKQTRKEAEEFMAKREDTSAGGTSWERIAKLVDVRPGGGKGAAVGKERFRELLGNLMKDENAPGAKGY